MARACSAALLAARAILAQLLLLLLFTRSIDGIHHEGDFIHTSRRAQFLRVRHVLQHPHIPYCSPRHLGSARLRSALPDDCSARHLQKRTQWHDLIEHHCPRFGHSRIVSIACCHARTLNAARTPNQPAVRRHSPHHSPHHSSHYSPPPRFTFWQVALPINKPSTEEDVSDYRVQLAFDGVPPPSVAGCDLHPLTP